MLNIRTIKYEHLRKVITTSNTPEPLFDTPLVTTEFEFHCDSGNSGSVYLGNENVNTDWIPRAADSTVSYNAEDIDGEPKMFDLSQIYIYGTAGDIVKVQYRDK